MPEELRMPYAVAEARSKFRIASANSAKNELVRRILALHPDEPALLRKLRKEGIFLED